MLEWNVHSDGLCGYSVQSTDTVAADRAAPGKPGPSSMRLLGDQLLLVTSWAYVTPWKRQLSPLFQPGCLVVCSAVSRNRSASVSNEPRIPWFARSGAKSREIEAGEQPS